MKVKRLVTSLIVEAEGDDAQQVLSAYNDGLELAQKAVVAGSDINRKRTIDGVTVRVCVEIEDRQ